MSYTRRSFLASCTAVTGIGTAAAATTAKRPNVLFILVDEWRAQATPWNHDPNLMTPTLARLAAESTSFDLAVSGTPVCCPYRASLMTGQYPLTHGVFINDVELKPKGATLGETFRQAGYQTGFIGKWHIYGSPDGNYGRRLAYIPPEKRFGFEYWKACECTHEYNKSLYYEGNDPEPKYWPGYDAFAQTDDACAFIDRKAAGAEPFCLVLSMGPPHFPLNTAPEKYQALYRERKIELRPNVPADKKAEAITAHRGYYAHMAALDDCLDRLLKTLDRNRIAEDTIVVFTSDHGDMMLSQGLTTKLYPWDESIRVPFLVRYPRQLTKPRRLQTPLNSPDIFPTLLGLTGLPIPTSVEGSNLAPYMTGQKRDDLTREALISLPVPITEARRYGFSEYRGLRTTRYTYLRNIKGPWLLYDNQQDPYQKRNLIGHAETKKVQMDLEKRLVAQLKLRKDEFLPAGDYIARAGVGHYREVNVPVGNHPSPWGDWD